MAKNQKSPAAKLAKQATKAPNNPKAASGKKAPAKSSGAKAKPKKK